MNRPVTKSGDWGRRGVTLLELVFVVGILGVVLGVLFGMAIGVGDTSRVQAVGATSCDEARRGMLYVTRELRCAAAATLSTLPSTVLTFQRAEDVDANGSAVDVGVSLETGSNITIRRDSTDLNADGITDRQLVRVQDGNVFVLANNLATDEDGNGNGTLDLGEDVNRNGRLDRGIWFQRDGTCITVLIQTQGRLRNGREILFTLNETVFPRN